MPHGTSTPEPSSTAQHNTTQGKPSPAASAPAPSAGSGSRDGSGHGDGGGAPSAVSGNGDHLRSRQLRESLTPLSTASASVPEAAASMRQGSTAASTPLSTATTTPQSSAAPTPQGSMALRQTGKGCNRDDYYDTTTSYGGGHATQHGGVFDGGVYTLG
eukprot:scaffold49554_cov19-Tisochrysis_lutea.AAC.1